MEERQYFYSIDILRLLLMFFVCIQPFGFPGGFSEQAAVLAGFAPAAFFILSGFLVLKKDGDRKKRIVRSIQNAAGMTLILTLVYFILNTIFYSAYRFDIFSTFSNWRFWFNYFVLGVWQYDIGKLLWYVQALLVAYCIIFLLNKIKLLRVDWLLALILLAFSFYSGEFAKMANFEFMGYTYLPANFLTRALPYILLGSALARIQDFIRGVPPVIYAFLAVAGGFLTIKEVERLQELDMLLTAENTIGTMLMALFVCLIAIARPLWGQRLPFFSIHANVYLKTMVCVCPLLGYMIPWSLGVSDAVFYNSVKDWMGLIVFFVSFLIALLFGWINDLLIQRFGSKIDLEYGFRQRIDWGRVFDSFRPKKSDRRKARNGLTRIRDLVKDSRSPLRLTDQLKDGFEGLMDEAHFGVRRQSFGDQLRFGLGEFFEESKRRRRPLFAKTFWIIWDAIKPDKRKRWKH